MKFDPLQILHARILIVDDQQANTTLLELLLRDAGYTQIFTTNDPRQVSALHRSEPFDLILLDLQMPEMDGFQVMEVLKTHESDPYLPVIVLTAQPKHRLQALLAGAKDFICKPFDMVEVKTRINNMLEVRLLYKKLSNYSKDLEQAVEQRTMELRESEARIRSLTELASDWYWEQDEAGHFTRVSGPVLDLLGIRVGNFSDSVTEPDSLQWNEQERSILLAKILAQEPFLDFVLSRIDANGVKRTYQVSGEPMFNQNCGFVGYRGVGLELLTPR